MDILTISITKVHSVQEYRHCVLVDCDTDCYGGKTQHNHVCFIMEEWNNSIRSTYQYKETQGHSANSIEYFEGLTDDEYFQRFCRTLKDFTDAELVEEVNRRIQNILWNTIGFDVKLITKEKR